MPGIITSDMIALGLKLVGNHGGLLAAIRDAHYMTPAPNNQPERVGDGAFVDDDKNP